MIRPLAVALTLASAGAASAYSEDAATAGAPPWPTAVPVAPQPAAVSPSPQPAASPASHQPAERLATVRLRSGEVLRGRIVSRDEGQIVIDSEDGVRSIVPIAAVAELLKSAADTTQAPWESDPNRTRYLYTPSAFMLRQGEAYVSQTELLLTTVAFGATDWLTLGVGGAIPIWFFGGEAFHLVALVKAGGQVTPGLHVAGTVQSLLAPGLDAATVGLAFGTVTIGRPDLHLGVSAGVPFVAGDDEDPGSAAFSVGGVARVSSGIALVGEMWFLPGAKNNTTVGGYAIRFIGSRLAVDAGFVLGDDFNVPIPWIDFTWNY